MIADGATIIILVLLGVFLATGALIEIAAGRAVRAIRRRIRGRRRAA